VAELSLCWFAMSACEEDGADAGSAGREIGNPVVAHWSPAGCSNPGGRFYAPEFIFTTAAASGLRRRYRGDPAPQDFAMERDPAIRTARCG
jgi:hypothetical protein